MAPEAESECNGLPFTLEATFLLEDGGGWGGEEAWIRQQWGSLGLRPFPRPQHCGSPQGSSQGSGPQLPGSENSQDGTGPS
jgi:hypothetical protein